MDENHLQAAKQKPGKPLWLSRLSQAQSRLKFNGGGGFLLLWFLDAHLLEHGIGHVQFRFRKSARGDVDNHIIAFILGELCDACFNIFLLDLEKVTEKELEIEENDIEK